MINLRNCLVSRFENVQLPFFIYVIKTISEEEDHVSYVYEFTSLYKKCLHVTKGGIDTQERHLFKNVTVPQRTKDHYICPTYFKKAPVNAAAVFQKFSLRQIISIEDFNQ